MTMLSSIFRTVRPAYEIPDDDLIGEILIPGLCIAEDARIAAGFFTSRCLAQIAGGLAAFINDSESTLDLMVSPELSDEDRDAIRTALREPQAVLTEALIRLFEGARISASAIERHTVDALAYLVASNRLRMRIVLMERGIYHKKIWLMRSGDEWLAVHGSGNATERGLLVNGEQMAVDRAWCDGPQAQERIEIFLERWEAQWTNRRAGSLTVDATQALEILRRHAKTPPPNVSDFWNAWRQDHEAGLEPALPMGILHAPCNHRLQIPIDLAWREGRYAHQGKAVDALLKRAGGIVAIATGGGKTIGALIAATEIQNQTELHFCLVILVPTSPLVRQWVGHIRDFGVEPTVLTGSDIRKRRTEQERISLAFTTPTPRTEIVVMSISLFTKRDSPERRWLTSLSEHARLVLIADEVHNLGVPSFLDNPPQCFRHRIGLSATPIRQYDPDGTDKLFDYFGGPPVFEFSLDEAISAGCLVPYRYYVHIVEFDNVEMEHYVHLTEELARTGFRVDDDGATVALSPKIESLLRERRGLVEQADAKLVALEAELRSTGTQAITRTLIYTSAKPTVLQKPKQITEVNRMLGRLNIISHQYTYHETAMSRTRDILERFGAGEYQALTAMKVLDEGVDIPQTNTAFLLASSTVRREWIQRRGRILRQAPNKKRAYLHDFVVVPPTVDTPSGQSLLRSELRRVGEFARLAENEFDLDGPNKIIQHLEAMIRRT